MIYLLFGTSLTTLFIVWLLMLNDYIWGWTFSAIHGRKDGKMKFPPAYHLTVWLRGQHKRGDRIWGMIHNTFRSMTIIPVFLVLWWLESFNPLWGLLCLSRGIIMYIIGSFGERKYSGEVFEFLYGCVQGLSLKLAKGV